jgi:hypothetical protein
LRPPPNFVNRLQFYWTIPPPDCSC